MFSGIYSIPGMRHSSFELLWERKNVIEGGPFFPGRCIGWGFLKPTHYAFPFATTGGHVEVGAKAGLEIKILRNLGNHEELSSIFPYMQIPDTQLPETLDNIGPGIVVVLLILTL